MSAEFTAGPLALGGAPPLGWVAAALELFARVRRRATLSAAEARAVRELRPVVERVSKYVLAAQNLDDLNDRIDAALEFPEFTDFYLKGVAEFLLIAEPDVARRLDVDPPKDMLEFVGGSAPLLRRGAEYAIAIAEALAPVLQDPGLRQQFSDESAAGVVQNLEFLNAPDCPPEVARALLGALRSTVAMLALAGGVLEITPGEARQRSEAWLRHGVATQWVEGLRQFLTLLASTGLNVSEELVPAHERLDLAQIQERAHRMLEALKVLGDAGSSGAADAKFPLID